MSKIVVCYKWVLDEADIQIRPDQSLDTSRAKSKISEYDRNAIQAALEAASDADEVVSLTFGTGEAHKSLKDALSRGPAQGYLVCDDDALETDGAGTAKVLAEAIRKIGDTKLVFCAEGASDTYAHEVGPRLGVLLDMPVVSNVSSLSVDGDTLTATRILEGSTETVQVTLPAVVTVLPVAAAAPIPGLKMVLAASKKPTTEFSLEDLGFDAGQLDAKTEVASLVGYTMDRKNILIDSGDPTEKVEKLLAYLEQEGVLG